MSPYFCRDRFWYVLNASHPVSVETGVDLSRLSLCIPFMLELTNQIQNTYT